jgi:hypothetical protein
MGLAQLIKSIYTATKSTQAYVQNEMFLFPDVTNLTVTFTAGGANNTFGVWAPVADSAATTLASVFATRAGFLDQGATSNYSVDSATYSFEIGYGATPVVVARAWFISATAATGPLPYFIDLRSAQIPAGSTVVYRMMCSTGAATIVISFRYYFVV